jgi:hypothetical protein
MPEALRNGRLPKQSAPTVGKRGSRASRLDGCRGDPERPERGFADFINQLAAEGITGNRGQMSVYLVKTFQLLLYGS